MAKFKELSQYKQKILLELLTSQDLCKAIYYNVENFKEMPDIDDPSELIYKNVYPHFFVPEEADSEAKTYLTVHFQKFRLISNSFKSGLIYVTAFTHKSLFKTSYGTTRIDFLLNEIDEKLNGMRGIGLGRLQLYEMNELPINNFYSGAYISYEPVEFN